MNDRTIFSPESVQELVLWLYYILYWSEPLSIILGRSLMKIDKISDNSKSGQTENGFLLQAWLLWFFQLFISKDQLRCVPLQYE